ncbi:hypothetical protein TNCV_4507121 [Trichonephila clavipes]|nr:hypothetical protein TNCV_4507121 [Trichonephila clavipes]
MIGENASKMVACDHPPLENEMPQFTGRYCTQHHRRTPSMFHGWNQAVNTKCFCRFLPDEHTFIGLELFKLGLFRPDDLFPLELCPV